MVGGLIRRKKVEEGGTMGEGGSTVRVTRIPLTAIANDLLDCLERAVGKGTIFALEILTEGRNWKSKGHGRVQFETSSDARRASELSRQGKLRFQNANLEISLAHEQIVPRPLRPENRLIGGALHAGSMLSDVTMASYACWEIARAEVMPERGRVEFWVEDGGQVYRLEIHFGDIVSTHGLCFEDQNSDAILFRVSFSFACNSIKSKNTFIFCFFQHLLFNFSCYSVGYMFSYLEINIFNCKEGIFF